MHHSQILETLKSSFLFNFRTGNVFLDTIITGLVVILSTYVFSMTSQLHQKIAVFVQDVVSYLRNGGGLVRISISGRKIDSSQGSRLEYSNTFHAVLHRIKQLNCHQSGIHAMEEITAAGINRHGRMDTPTSNIIVNQANTFALKDNITGKVRIENNTAKGSWCAEQAKESLSWQELKIEIFSRQLSMDELLETVDLWVEEYQEFMGADKSLRYFHYSPIEMDKKSHDYYHRFDNSSSIPNTSYTELKFQSGKTFQNVFFPEKEEMMRNLDYFAANKNWYKRKGIPYTMGFLFHGEPGCGKTSTIKAIANHTARHIVSVPLNKIKNFNELLSVFYNTSINQKVIPLCKRLYVLEDIDCSDLKDIVKERDGNKFHVKEPLVEDETEKGLLKDLLNLKVSPLAAFEKQTELTLSTLLEILDGVLEMEGRMIVITTNYPEKLDKALVRPGRIDMNIKFGKCSGETLAQMYEHFYESPLEEGTVLPDDKWTPAEATQIFLKNLTCPSLSLDQLANCQD